MYKKFTEYFCKPAAYKDSSPVLMGTVISQETAIRGLNWTLVMKLITGLMLLGMMQLSAATLAQRITLKKQNARMETILDEIGRQSGYDVFVDLNTLKSAKPVTIDVRNATIEQVLEKCFEGQKFDFSIEDKSIVIKAKQPSILDKVASFFAEDIVISGQVVNKKTNEPLSGVSIKIKNRKISSGTNSKGEFNLSKLDPNAVIVFSFVGFDSVQVSVNAILGMKEGNAFSKNLSMRKIAGTYFIMVSLEPSVSYLDEMIVQGYGTTDRRLGTGNISKITEKDIETQPVMNPLLALQGRVPGMVVTPASGYASGPVKIEIRGRNTIDSKFTSDPLYIIDGVPLTYLEIGGFSSYQSGSTGIMQNEFPGAAAGQSPMYNLNPADIASIEVLKDADATAIYGSRGANGVILITTKKGKIGGTTFTVDMSQGISKVDRYWDMLNTKEYLAMRREAFKNDGIVPTIANAPDLMAWDTTRYTNWQKELWGNTGQLTTIATALAGGTENTQFRISGNYNRQTEILTASGANKRGSLAFNLTNYSLNRKFKTNLAVNYSYSDVNNAVTPNAVTLPPNAPPIYNSDGGLNYQDWNDVGLPNSYPFSSIRDILKSQTTLVTSNLNLAYELFKGFEMSSNFGYTNSHNSGGGATRISSQNPLYNPTGFAAYLTNDNQNWIIEPQFNYKTDIGKGRFTALLGGSLQSTVADSKTTFGFGYEDDNLLGSIGLAPITRVTDRSGVYKYAAVFSRLNYSWDEKYVVNLSGRRDGSSRFGKGKQYGNFGAIGLAWIASQEKWIKNVLPAFISFVKLRASYGITGSDAIGEYQYLSQWSTAVNGTPVLSYGGITPLVNLHAVNPNYQWQVNKKLEGSFSISFLQDRINFETAYYRNRCNNQLTDYPTPDFSGFPFVTANWPANLQNSGWEFSLSANLIDTKNFKWSVTMNGAVNKNVLISYPDIEHSPYATKYFIGRPLNAQYLFHYTGIDPMTGQYGFEDYHGDGVLTQNQSVPPGEVDDDRYITVNLDPKFVGGFGNQFRYKNWNLGLFFQYKNQMGINSFYSGQAAGAMANISSEVYNNHWSQPGQEAKYARFTTTSGGTDGYTMSSDLGFTDASYLRLSNVSLNYSIPEKILKNKRINIFMHAQNVWTWTKYRGLDPDTQSFASMPTAKVFVAGLSLSL